MHDDKYQEKHRLKINNLWKQNFFKKMQVYTDLYKRKLRIALSNIKVERKRTLISQHAMQER